MVHKYPSPNLMVQYSTVHFSVTTVYRVFWTSLGNFQFEFYTYSVRQKGVYGCLKRLWDRSLGPGIEIGEAGSTYAIWGLPSSCPFKWLRVANTNYQGIYDDGSLFQGPMLHWSIWHRIEESTFRANDSMAYSIVTETHPD